MDSTRMFMNNEAVKMMDFIKVLDEKNIEYKKEEHKREGISYYFVIRYPSYGNITEIRQGRNFCQNCGSSNFEIIYKDELDGVVNVEYDGCWCY